MSARTLTAGLLGIVVAVGLSVLAAEALNLSDTAAVLVAGPLGVICTLAAVTWVER